ncbi:Haloacid dehalogenase-like hydrolase [Butyrivibrio fibrisolvens DSM 3071]|uniref:Haloacid dehalogenase-like hydrolase n=1 Tax=Butyrivibrio fibrisolvens DSM 3071 TaxID=1121131 RepID=A0A1M5TR77_BUTFI|nr:HAD hydrolase-like protein [Butyrivibrio fibrisolvens]SHH53096.1 Haloacid dehalogenase-like hydrolase [Butyrivibrio fibrisolvens DSM 3071]
MSVFDTFTKKKDFIVCIDSDGCAIDSMNIKHIRCFGPCMVREWGLENWQEEILKSWNQVNLFTMTRGINRFKGLATALLEVNEKYMPIDGVEALSKWADEAPELSNRAVEAKISEDPIFAKALNWSKAVNEGIESLPKEEINPFEGVKDALIEIHKYCDVAVVSSANPEAVKAEWERFGLMEYVDLLCTQDMGSKAYCIGQIVKKGYAPENVLMCGDAVGDMEAARSNSVWFYPICVGQEQDSWKDFRNESLEIFASGKFSSEYQNELIDKFLYNLK